MTRRPELKVNLTEAECVETSLRVTSLDARQKSKRNFFFFFFTQVQTPVTFCSGESRWSMILVVRLAHSADLRSRLRHV